MTANEMKCKRKKIDSKTVLLKCSSFPKFKNLFFKSRTVFKRFYFFSLISDYYTASQQTRHGHRAGHADSRPQDDQARRLHHQGADDEPAHVPADLGRQDAPSGHSQAAVALDRQAAVLAYHPRQRQHDTNAFDAPRRGG